jgi:hypothetical protein
MLRCSMPTSRLCHARATSGGHPAGGPYDARPLDLRLAPAHVSHSPFLRD